MRKLLMGAAAIALPAGILASSAGVAAAKPSPVVLTNASVTCTSVTGTAKFAPRITATGGNPENMNVKLALGGCTASGATVSVMSGSAKGVLHLPSNSATTLTGTNSATGQLNIKWSTSPKPAFKMSTVNVTAITGGVTGGGFASFSLTIGSVTNDFQGTDNGASSSFYAETTQNAVDLGTALSGKGIKEVNFGPNADAAAYHLTLG